MGIPALEDYSFFYYRYWIVQSEYYRRVKHTLLCSNKKSIEKYTKNKLITTTLITKATYSMLSSSKFNKQIWYEEEFNPELLPILIL